MVDGISEQDEVHSDDTGRVVVLDQEVHHLLLQSSGVGDVLVDFLGVDVVAWAIQQTNIINEGASRRRLIALRFYAPLDT